MKILSFVRSPFFWLALYLFVVVLFSLIFLNSLGQQSSLRLTATTSQPQGDEMISISVPDSSIDEKLPAYLTLDSSNRRAIVGTIPVTGYSVDIEIIADQAYVVTRDEGVKVFDLTVASQPEMSGKLSADVHGWRINTDGKGLYLSTVTSGLRIYPEPGEPRAFRINTIGSAFASIHRGAHIFVADGEAGLSIFQIKREDGGRTRSRPLGHLNLPGLTVDLTFLESSLVAASMSGGLHLVDISDSGNPRLLQTIVGEKIYERVWVVGDTLYASDKDRQLDLYNLSNGRLTPVGSLPLVGKVRDFLLDGERLYITESSFGVSVLNVRDPEHPQRSGFVGIPGEAAGLSIYGEYLYVASSSQGVQIVDTRRFEPLNVMASFDTSDNAVDLVLDGRWLYVADGLGGLQVIDRSDASNLKIVACLPTRHAARYLAKAGDIVFVALSRQGVVAVDVTDPFNPRHVNQLKQDVSFSDLAVRGSTLFASSYDGKLLKIDISDPGDLRVTDSIDLPGRPRRIALAGDDVLIAAGKAGLLVVRFAPEQPGRLIASLPRPWPMRDFSQAFGLVVRGNYAYLIQGKDGLQIVDIGDPENPKEVDFISLPDRGLSIGLSQTYVVVSTRWNGFYFFDISQPGKAYLAANIYLPRTNGEFMVEGERLYATGYTNGINVVPLPIKNIKAIRSSDLALTFNKPQLPGWYDLSVSDGKQFVRAASVLKVD
jgi:hypothetical protein